MSDTRIDLMRHGEPVGGRRYRGNGCDDPLSDAGWRQMWAAAGAAPDWELIVTSPMRRCRAFATELATRRGLPLTLDERLREVGFGDWEGRSPEEILANSADMYEAFYRDPVRNRPPRAEPLDAFSLRVSAALEETAAAHPGRRLLVVTHAGVIRAVVGHVLRAAPERWYRIAVGHAGITRIRYARHGPVLDHHNLAGWRAG
jgi:probable phosphoglycerate mutase